MPSPKSRSSDRRGKSSSTSRTTSERPSSTRSRRSDGPNPASRSESTRSRRSDGPNPASRSESTRSRRSDGPASSPRSASKPSRRSDASATAPRSSSARGRRSDSPAPAGKQRQSRPKRSDIVEPSQPVRLNKAIADAGVASRRRADELISSGCVRINGAIVVDLGTRVEIDDVVTVNGEPITRQKHLTYILLNKPKDLITTSRDEKGRATVFDVVRLKTRLFSVGRLDRNTTGVLLLTNDGDLANRLMHPRYGVTRVYRAALDRPLRTDHMRRIASGVELEDGPTQPCDVIIDPEDKTVVVLAIREGRNREVRRIFEHVGYEVKRLDRKEYAGLSTRGLKRGEYRHLTRDEVDQLYRLVDLTQ